jgi:uncharacterized protein
MKARNVTSGKELAGNLTVAATPFARVKGLLGRTALSRGEGLLLTPCKGVHTFFMKFSIDVVFLDRGNRVVAAIEHLQPQRMTKLLLSSVSALELPAGTVAATKTAPGNEVLIE